MSFGKATRRRTVQAQNWAPEDTKALPITSDELLYENLVVIWTKSADDEIALFPQLMTTSGSAHDGSMVVENLVI